MARPYPSEQLIGRHAAAGLVLADRRRQEPMEPRALIFVELVDVIRGNELHLGALGKIAGLVEHETAALHASSQRLGHGGSV